MAVLYAEHRGLASGVKNTALQTDMNTKEWVTPAFGPFSFWYDAVMMTPLPIHFFDYTCDRCGAPVCERVQLMNLALNYEEELFCLDCLAAEQDMSPEALADFAKSYVYSRDCFKNPWMKFDATPCPKRTDGLCFCQDTAS